MIIEIEKEIEEVNMVEELKIIMMHMSVLCLWEGKVHILAHPHQIKIFMIIKCMKQIEQRRTYQGFLPDNRLDKVMIQMLRKSDNE